MPSYHRSASRGDFKAWEKVWAGNAALEERVLMRVVLVEIWI